MTTILIITDNLPDQINGVVTTFTNLARIGEAEGFRVVFLTPNDFFYADCPGYNEVKLSIPFFIGSKIEKINPFYLNMNILIGKNVRVMLPPLKLLNLINIFR